MKKDKKVKQILSSDAVKFQRLKIAQWVSLTLMLISGAFATTMTMYYSYKPGDFGVEMPKILAFVGIGFVIFFTILFITFFFLTKRMLKK